MDSLIKYCYGNNNKIVHQLCCFCIIGSIIILVQVVVVVRGVSDSRNLGRFNYRQTVLADFNNRTDVYDYGPKDWGLIECLDPQVCVSLFIMLGEES